MSKTSKSSCHSNNNGKEAECPVQNSRTAKPTLQVSDPVLKQPTFVCKALDKYNDLNNFDAHMKGSALCKLFMTGSKKNARQVQGNLGAKRKLQPSAQLDNVITAIM